MSDPRVFTTPPPSLSSTVPSGRFNRLMRMGQMATGVAGNMLLAGARELAQGRRPNISDLLLTPANALKITQQLAQMRGAAMKVGQLISMDAGDLLPPEMAAILASLRSDAHAMPQRQVQAVLTANWGAQWQRRFEPFSFTPVAAASIGQVHRAKTLDGRDLAIKIQYPGVRIDVYEQESELFFQDHSGKIIDDELFQRLMTFPNVLVTGHQGFFTIEALREIAQVTVDNLRCFVEGEPCPNAVLAPRPTRSPAGA